MLFNQLLPFRAEPVGVWMAQDFITGMKWTSVMFFRCIVEYFHPTVFTVRYSVNTPRLRQTLDLVYNLSYLVSVQYVRVSTF